MRVFLILYLTSFSLIIAQTSETIRWEKKKLIYEIPIHSSQKKIDLNYKSTKDFVIKPLINIYRLFISNVDGDNCPFEPSCSEFFLEATDKTNLLTAVLLFSDRLQRDSNFLNRSKYKRTKNHNLLDPIQNYLSE